MTLTLSVLRCPDAVPPETKRINGGELRIGRGADNDWIMPDPDKMLSKRHCVIAFRNGGWAVADTSTNGTFLNRDESPIGSGQVRGLADGDRIRIGAYEIEVRIAEEAAFQPARGGGFGAAKSSVFDDPFNDDVFAPPPQIRETFASSAFGSDPLFGGPAQPPSITLPNRFDPMAPGMEDDFLSAPTQPDHTPSFSDAFTPPQVIGQSLPDDDWDLGFTPAPKSAPPAAFTPMPLVPAPAPYAPPAPPPQAYQPPPPAYQPPAPPAYQPPPASYQPAAAPQPAYQPPPPAPPAYQPPPTAYEPPPASAPPAPLPYAPPAPQQAYQPPAAPPYQPPAPAQYAPSPGAPPSPFDDDPFAPSVTTPGPEAAPPQTYAPPPQPASQAYAPPPPQPAAPAYAPPQPPAQAAPAYAPPQPATPAYAPPPPPAQTDELLTAFLAGAGVKGKPENATALMRSLGAAFRATVGGIRQALIARASIKGEFRIEQTMIRSRGNNPLKFSADDDDALSALLGLGRRSEMKPEAAIADALRDMRLHELATVAAMQDAVRALMAQLAPAKIRAETQAGGMSLLPAQKTARAFEAYEKLHDNVTRALADDFDSVFGKSFARAYELALRDISAKDTP